MNKKINFSKPNKVQLADTWVQSGGEEKIYKRLTVDIPEDLHTQIKVFCAKKMVKINKEIIPILQKHFSLNN